MKQIDLTDAEDRLSQIVREVHLTGEPVQIVNAAGPLATINPADAELAERRRRHHEAVAAVRAGWTDAPPVTREEIRDAIEEGRM